MRFEAVGEAAGEAAPSGRGGSGTGGESVGAHGQIGGSVLTARACVGTSAAAQWRWLARTHCPPLCVQRLNAERRGARQVCDADLLISEVPRPRDDHPNTFTLHSPSPT